MESKKCREILIVTLQKGLVGNLTPKSNVTPQKLADAIISNVNFSKSYTEMENERLVSTLRTALSDFDKDMHQELDKLKREEKLLANFIHGKLTAYAEILEIINSL